MATKDWQNRHKGKVSSMLIDPYFNGDFMDEYPSLLKIGPLRPEINDVNKYIIACSFLLDPNSPYVQEQPDITKRRDLVYDEVVYGGLTDLTFEVRMLLNLYKNNEWSLFCADQVVFNEYVERVISPLGNFGEDIKKEMDAALLKDKYLDVLDKILDRNNRRFVSIFGQDKKLGDEGKQIISSLESMAKYSGEKGRIN